MTKKIGDKVRFLVSGVVVGVHDGHRGTGLRVKINDYSFVNVKIREVNMLTLRDRLEIVRNAIRADNKEGALRDLAILEEELENEKLEQD